MEVTSNQATKSIRAFLKEAIIKKNGSIAEFSRQNKIDKSDLAKFLRGDKDWTFAKVVKLLTFINASININIDTKKWN